jgi:acyl-CoA thioester hydrolase
MLKNCTQLRVRYNETDQMGVVNNAQYASYFEVGRTELFRDLGISYAKMEREGMMLPVSELYVKYHRSAFYDDLLLIETSVPQMPTSRLRFDYKIINANGICIAEGYTVLAFMDGNTRRPMRTPGFIVEALGPFFPPQ